MKVDLSKALEELKAAEFVDGTRYMTVQAELNDNLPLSSKNGLSWKLYAHSADGKRTAWSEEAKTFDLALASLKKALLPPDRFVEEN